MVWQFEQLSNDAGEWSGAFGKPTASILLLALGTVPLWQLMQVAAATIGSVWSNVAGFHAATVWHKAQSFEDTTCVPVTVSLPVAVVPSWHEKHVPMACVWSNFATGFQAVVVWQSAQRLLLLTCLPEIESLPLIGLISAWAPSWQEKQVAPATVGSL